MFRFFQYIFLIHGALAARRLVVDKKSCAPDGVYNAVYYAAQSAISMASQAADVYNDYIDKGIKPDDRYMGQARQLLGADDVDTVMVAFKRFYNIGTYELVDFDIYGDDWAKTRDNMDAVIVCNADHIEAITIGGLDPNINHRNVIQDVPVPDGRLVLRIKDKDPQVQAVTAQRPAKSKRWWPAAAVEVITISPLYIEALQAASFPVYNDDLIKKARFQSLVALIKQKFKLPTYASVDTLQTFQFTLLHEFQHLALSGLATDVDGKNSYLWDNCIRLHTAQNAENVAYLALTVDLIKNHNFEVSAEGLLRTIR